MEVIPSIDVENANEMNRQIQRLLPYYTRFQIDIADGDLVPFKSLELIDALNSLKQFPEIMLDLHLMITDYQSAIEQITQSSLSKQVKIVFIHTKIHPPLHSFEAGRYPFTVGLAINPEEKIDTIVQHYNVETIKAIQIMSVNPGPQGSPFLRDTIQKIEQLRHLDYRNDIFLDGGINSESLQLILRQQYKPNYICPGSFFSKAENIKERVQYLSEVLAHAHNDNSHA